MLPELNAAIGIDIETATKEQLAKRVFEYCGEMAECYVEGCLENIAFQAIQLAVLRMNGGTFNAD